MYFVTNISASASRAGRRILGDCEAFDSRRLLSTAIIPAHVWTMEPQVAHTPKSLEVNVTSLNLTGQAGKIQLTNHETVSMAIDSLMEVGNNTEPQMTPAQSTSAQGLFTPMDTPPTNPNISDLLGSASW